MFRCFVVVVPVSPKVLGATGHCRSLVQQRRLAVPVREDAG